MHENVSTDEHTRIKSVNTTSKEKLVICEETEPLHPAQNFRACGVLHFNIIFPYLFSVSMQFRNIAVFYDAMPVITMWLFTAFSFGNAFLLCTPLIE
jgi:hypothetical protein